MGQGQDQTACQRTPEGQSGVVTESPTSVIAEMRINTSKHHFLDISSTNIKEHRLPGTSDNQGAQVLS